MKLTLLVFAVCTTTTLVVSAHPQNKILDHPRSNEAFTDDDNDEATVLETSKSLYGVGNSRCRAGHPCDYYGYTYMWCYLEEGYKSWEYCCVDKCDFFGQAYRWCHTGSTWDYCGEYEKNNPLKRTLFGLACSGNHGCGKHDYYSTKYYCNTDVQTPCGKTWDWCCEPGSKCAKGKCYIDDGQTEEMACWEKEDECGPGSPCASEE